GRKGRLVPVQIPIGAEGAFTGVVDLVRMKDVPAGVADIARESREKLIEAADETDDELLSKYLEEGTLREAELARALRAGIMAGTPVPVLCASATKPIGHIAWLQGKTQKNAETLGPGEIGLTAKLKETLTGDSLGDEAHPFALPRIEFPEPSMSFAIQPKTRGDEDKISNALHRMSEE